MPKDFDINAIKRFLKPNKNLEIRVYVDIESRATGHKQNTLILAQRIRSLGFQGTFLFVLGIKEPKKPQVNQATDYFTELNRYNQENQQYKDCKKQFEELLNLFLPDEIGEYFLSSVTDIQDENIETIRFGFTGGIDDTESNLAKLLKVKYCLVMQPYLWKYSSVIWLLNPNKKENFLAEDDILPFSNPQKANLATSLRGLSSDLDKLIYKPQTKSSEAVKNRRVVITYNVKMLPDVDKVFANIITLLEEIPCDEGYVILNFNSGTGTVIEPPNISNENILYASIGYVSPQNFNLLIKHAFFVVCEGQGTATNALTLGTMVLHKPQFNPETCQIYSKAVELYQTIAMTIPDDKKQEEIKLYIKALQDITNKVCSHEILSKENAKELVRKGILQDNSLCRRFLTTLSSQITPSCDKFSAFFNFFIFEILKLPNIVRPLSPHSSCQIYLAKQLLKIKSPIFNMARIEQATSTKTVESVTQNNNNEPQGVTSPAAFKN